LRNEVVEELICDQGGKSRVYLNIELVRSGRKRRKEREKGRRGEESKKNQEKRPQGSTRRARLSEARERRDNRSVYDAVAKSSAVAKVFGTPNSLIVT
jgi:hypothetical protein